MTTYIKQYDSYSCGPIAYLNILNHFGASFKTCDLPKYRKLLKTNKEYGTSTTSIFKALRSSNFRVSRRRFNYEADKVYLACYISDSKGVMHYIVVAAGEAINFHHYNEDKVYTRYKLPKRWIESRIRRDTIYL